jgi:hypothetical protein
MKLHKQSRQATDETSGIYIRNEIERGIVGFLIAGFTWSFSLESISSCGGGSNAAFSRQVTHETLEMNPLANIVL